MRLWTFVFASTLLAAVVVTPALAQGAVASDHVIRWEDFDDPGFDPTRVRAASSGSSRTLAKPSRASSIVLGPLGVDDDGVEGRVHTVVRRETLWDISEAYLGTPWVWPSVWNENEEIANPHVIEPGDLIWITSNEMRRVSAEEAEELMNPVPEPAAESVADEIEYLEEPEFAALPELEEPVLPVAVPLELEPEAGPMMPGETITLPPDQAGMVATSAMMEAAGAILDGPSLRVYLTQKDEVYLGLGEGEVNVGDQFTIFREVREVRDPETHRLLGHHIDELGWLRVMSVEGESSIGLIEEAIWEIQRGDQIIPRTEHLREIEVREPQPGLNGLIALMPGHRLLMGSTDSVYVYLGSIHGIEVGTKLEVYRSGADFSGSRGRGAPALPDTVVAELVVISVQPEVSAAFVMGTRRELQIGDDVRGATPPRFAGR